MSNFKVGDKVVCVDNTDYSEWLDRGEEYTITSVHDNGNIAVDSICGNCGWQSCRFKKVEPTEPKTTEIKKTGGSTPNQYRLSVNLPLTSDRTKFVDVDLEAMDVSDALDLSGNLRDVQKALFRMGKKDGVSEAYDFNKQLFCTLREMKKRGIISHAKFWEASTMLEKVLNEH